MNIELLEQFGIHYKDHSPQEMSLLIGKSVMGVPCSLLLTPEILENKMMLQEYAKMMDALIARGLYDLLFKQPKRFMHNNTPGTAWPVVLDVNVPVKNPILFVHPAYWQEKLARREWNQIEPIKMEEKTVNPEHIGGDEE